MDIAAAEQIEEASPDKEDSSRYEDTALKVEKKPTGEIFSNFSSKYKFKEPLSAQLKHDKLLKPPESKLESVQNKKASSHISETNEKVKVQQEYWEEIEGISDTEETAHSDDASEIHFYKMMAEAAKFLKESKIE